MIKLTENIFAIEVPGDASGFNISDELLKMQTAKGFRFQGLPPGSHSFLCTSTEITEEQCKEIVETDILGFHSLLRSKSLGRVAIIKKV
jgi:hypothetical protein